MMPKLSLAERRQMLSSRVILARALCALALIFNFAFSTHVEAQVGSFFVRDFPVDNPAVTDKMRLLNSATAAEDGSVIMLHYHDIWYKTGAGPGNHWLYFRDMNTGAESHVLLPDYVGIGHPVTDNGQAIDLAGHVLVGLSELWIFAKNPDLSSVSVWHYALRGSPLPTQASLIERLDFGDQDSHMRSLIQLRSGALLATWYQYPGWGEPNPNPDKHLDFGFAYRSPDGQWSTEFPVEVPNGTGGGIMMSNTAVAQHPADDSIWVFNKRDSYHSMEVIHLSETTSGVEVDWVDPLFLNEMDDGAYSPEAEFPHLVARADPWRNSIQLAYQMNDYIMWRDPHWRKDARVALAEIKSDDSMSFTASPFPAYVERVSTMAMVVEQDKVVLVSRPIDGSVHPLPYLGFNLISHDYSTGLWDPSFVRLGQFGYLTGAVPVAGQNQPLFALLLNDARIHNMAVVEGPVPIELEQFHVGELNGGADIHWRTSSENGTLGWNVVRSDHPEGPYVAVNGLPIEGNGSSTPVAMTYQFLDSDVSPGATYYYKLERLHGQGPSEYSEALALTLLPVGEPPVADAGPDRTVSLTEGAEREPVLLDANRSFDPGGAIVDYGWYKSGGWMTSEKSPTVRLTEGVHTLTLRVTDNDGVTASDDVVIRVSTGSTEIGEIALNVGSSLDLGEDATATPGDSIRYSLSLQNTGTLTLTNVTVTEPTLSNIDCGLGTNTIATLAPGEGASCSGAYAIRQADIDTGVKHSTAIALTQDPNGNEVSDQRSQSHPIPQTAAIGLTTSDALDMGANGTVDPGDPIHYSFTVENTGNVTLTNVTVTEPSVNPIDCGGGTRTIDTMPPGTTATCTGVHALTQADIDAGSKETNAIATGYSPNGTVISAQNSWTIGNLNGPLVAPSNLTAEPSGSNVVLSWADNSVNESGFAIERREKIKGSISYIQIADVGPDVTGFTEKLPSGTYYYRVRAFNVATGQVSEYSNVADVRIKVNPGRTK